MVHHALHLFYWVLDHIGVMSPSICGAQTATTTLMAMRIRRRLMVGLS
jgi:hypothetical protein